MDDTISDKKRKCFEKCLQMSIALQDLRCGKFDSIYETAKVHNLKYSTFRDFIVGKTKEFGMGSGRKSIVFEPEEEERIVGLILNESNFGLTLTRKIIRDILTDEWKLKKLLNPDRSLPLKDLGAKGQEVQATWVSRFIKRNDLKKFLDKLEEQKPRPYECDLCSSAFTFKNCYKTSFHFL